MSNRSEALHELRKAANRRKRAERARREATGYLRTQCRRAHEAGVSITEIAHVAGLSRQGVYDLLGDDRRPS